MLSATQDNIPSDHLAAVVTLPASSLPRPAALVTSLLLHLLVAGCLSLPAWLSSLPAPPAPSLSGRTATLLVPALSPESSTRRTQQPPSRGAAAASLPPGSPRPRRSLDGIAIAVLPDYRRQLLPVLRRFDGRIGVATLVSPRSLRESFRARDFQPLGPTRFGDWVAFRLWDPEAWPELAPILSLCPEDCIFYALFPPALQSLILHCAIRHVRPGQSLFRIHLRFDAASPSGFLLVAVEALSGEKESKGSSPSDVSFHERHWP